MKENDLGRATAGGRHFIRSMFLEDSADDNHRQFCLHLSKLSCIIVEHDHHVPNHAWDFIELVIPHRGFYRCLVNGNMLTVLPGQAVIIQPFDRHEDFYQAGSELVFIQFTISNMFNRFGNNRVFGTKSLAEHRLVDIAPDSMPTRILGLALEHEKNSGSQLIAVGKLCEAFFWDLVGLVPENALDAEFMSVMKHNAFIKQMEEYFHRHIDRKLEVDKLAAEFGMSRRSLENKFAALFGNSPSNTFINLKINVAAGMLRSGISIKETAEKLGFSDQFYFSTVFKRVMGYAPSLLKQH